MPARPLHSNRDDGQTLTTATLQTALDVSVRAPAEARGAGVAAGDLGAAGAVRGQRGAAQQQGHPRHPGGGRAHPHPQPPLQHLGPAPPLPRPHLRDPRHAARVAEPAAGHHHHLRVAAVPRQPRQPGPAQLPQCAQHPREQVARS